MTRVTRRALSTLTALAMVGTLFIGAPGPVRATADHIYIGFNTHMGGGSCTDPDFTATGTADSTEIANAVTATNAGGTLHFCPGTYGINATINLAGKLITLQGAAAATTILDGGGTTRILTSSGAITVSNLTFDDGYTGHVGGAIYATATVTVTDSTFADNTAGYGGAIYSGTTATVTDSTFTNNTATQAGAIWASGTATVTDSTFTGNTANLFGAIRTTTATVTGSTFTGNTANYYAGAIYATTVTATDSTFTNNDADYGGAILADNTATVTASTFTNNDADYGGAILADNTATVTASTFTRNSATTDGGAILANTGTIAGSRFTRNTAGGHGGAVHLWAPNSDNLQQLRRNTFTRNQAGVGGAITLGSCGPAVSRSQVRSVERANRFSANRATQQRRTNNIESETGYCGD